MKVYPEADIFPLMTDDELQDLAADIKQNGLIHPLITTADGEYLVDGRNREKACKIAGVNPVYEKLDGQTPEAYIVAANLQRRNLTKGQQAMAYTMIYPKPGQRGKKDIGRPNIFSGERLSKARSVLKQSSKLAEAVLKGITSLDEALETVKEQESRFNSAESQLARLRTTAPDLADQVDEDRLKLTEAIAAYDQRKREKEAAEEAATGQLAKIMTLTFPGKTSPKDVAREWFENINPEFWVGIPGRTELTGKCLGLCVEVLDELVKLWDDKIIKERKGK